MIHQTQAHAAAVVLFAFGLGMMAGYIIGCIHQWGQECCRCYERRATIHAKKSATGRRMGDLP